MNNTDFDKLWADCAKFAEHCDRPREAIGPDGTPVPFWLETLVLREYASRIQNKLQQFEFSSHVEELRKDVESFKL